MRTLKLMTLLVGVLFSFCASAQKTDLSACSDVLEAWKANRIANAKVSLARYGYNKENEETLTLSDLPAEEFFNRRFGNSNAQVFLSVLSKQELRDRIIDEETMIRALRANDLGAFYKISGYEPRTPEEVSGAISENEGQLCAYKARVAQLTGKKMMPMKSPSNSNKPPPQLADASDARQSNSASNENQENNNSKNSGGSCRDKIIAIQLQGDAKYKANRGNRLSQARAMFETNQAQKELFSGECASEPDATKYVSSAETSMQDWGSKCQQAGGGSDCGVTTSQSSSNSTQADSGSNTTSSPSSSNSTQAESDSSTGASEDNRRVYDGLVTDHCVRFKPLNRADGGIAWFALENGCNETIKVWYGNVGSNYFGSLMDLKAGRSDKSWYDYKKYSGVNYIGCKEKIHGKDVYLDKKTNSCYYYK